MGEKPTPNVTVSRAQSTVLGTIMLVAVVVVTVTVFGTYSIVSVTDSRTGPVVEQSASVTTADLTVVHEGGEAMETGVLTVLVRTDGTEATYSFADGTLAGDGDDRFEPGERWTVPHGLALDDDDRVRVLVVHDDEWVVLDATRAVEG